ncbi:SixA phosphatase family protein [Pedobacter agri]|uniref:Phosphoglycerate mutase family protein n=1 Tax=Pedobacter agri TaxID=454586 RepID=A0A9X3DB58_9SPHI|nr:phosphoglycerate mutase family protein [Pedobacter agri]MCX3264332.1 phosphoglycerate mutase family protein [Pedobacter agri]MDQ1140905.1 broad specificity phosphatase PhoE [Pedobacter agri]
MKRLILFFSLSFLISTTAFAQNTEVWVVRHAEKDKTNPEDKDPNLSDEGRIRAADLAIYLKKVKFDVGFSTPYKRTHQTLDSLIIPKVINYKDPKSLVDSVKKNYVGKTIIVAGHSNTVLEIIEAFGGKRPMEMLTDDDYDYIFRLTVKDDKAKVKKDQFGRPHHL